MFEYIMGATRSLIAPPVCAYCYELLSEETVFCSACTRLIVPIRQTSFVVAGYKVVVHALSSYQGPLKDLVLAKNYSCYRASVQLGDFLAQHPVLANKPDYLVPIPLYWARYAWRGYNQTEVMARRIGALKNIPVDSCFYRSRKMTFQSLFSMQEGSDNIRESFSLISPDNDKYRDTTLVLVDDVMMSGATLKEAARKLALLRPASIGALVVCRTQ